MAKYKSKAEKNFESRFRLALEFKDFKTIQILLNRLGHFYELIDDQPYIKNGERFFEWVPEKFGDLDFGEWTPPSFERESQVEKWRAELDVNFLLEMEMQK